MKLVRTGTGQTGSAVTTSDVQDLEAQNDVEVQKVICQKIQDRTMEPCQILVAATCQDGSSMQLELSLHQAAGVLTGCG